MKNMIDRDFTVYPRRFNAYRWYKPILAGVLFFVFYVLFASLVYLIASLVFHTPVAVTGYDGTDYYSAGGAFFNFSIEAVYIPSFLIAARIVKDRPFSSYFSSMGGWRWKIFGKTLAAGFVLFGIPYILRFLLIGKSTDIRFTAGGFILLVLLAPLLCVAEELLYRSYITQTVSSWFRLPVIGMIVQTVLFAAVHPYNLTGLISIALSAVIYVLICYYSRGIEASSALHILNNLIGFIMSGLGFGSITAEQTISSTLFPAALKLLFLVFIIYAARKLHWFDELTYDDTEPFNADYAAKKRKD